MWSRVVLASAAFIGFAVANNNSAFAFTANTYLQFDNSTFTNHESFVAYLQARDHVIELNPAADNASTSCPTRVQAAGNCPTPTPANDKTQFNTTLDQNGPLGEMYMNVAVPGGQQLYVQRDGLLRYTAPHRSPPADSYTNLFQLEQHFEGSQLFISTPTLLWNNSGLYWYSCAPPNGGLNLTYAPTPEANVTGCLPVAIISDAVWVGDDFPACPINPTTDSQGNPIAPQCGYAAYQYN